MTFGMIIFLEVPYLVESVANLSEQEQDNG